ncbi:glutathione S-transferase [Emcibacter sp. SYSU 3D8]|uniref:glutathione S-transferase family protein n=1 Tax=Emcibacter sp. SYSU 3D8 TaxID=3133969 RepID=UPI0031FEF6E9
MITVHHLNNSKSQRIVWLLEELGLDYRLEFYRREPTLAAPPEMRDVHPLGKAPIVEIDGQVMAESGAIIEYIVQRYGNGQLMPAPDTADYARYLEVLHYAEGSANPILLISMMFPMFGIDNPVATGFLTNAVKLHLDYIEGMLENRDYFAGDRFTAADLHITFNLQMAQASNLIGDRPRMLAFLDRVTGRPAYLRAIEKGGPFDLTANRR